jgi:hypothetical protein
MLTTQKGDPILFDNYRPIALMNNMLKLRTTLTKHAGSKYSKTHGINSEQQDGFRLLCNIHDELASIIMMMEEAKIYNKDIFITYADFKGAFNAAYHCIIFKHMRQLGMLPTFVDTCEQLLYGVSTTNNSTPHGPTPSIDINRANLQGDTLSSFLLTLFLEPFLRLFTVGSPDYRPGASTTNANPT